MTHKHNSTAPATPTMHLSPDPSKSESSPSHVPSSHQSSMATPFPSNSLDTSTITLMPTSIDYSTNLFEDWLSTASEMIKPSDAGLWFSADFDKFPESDDSSSHTTLNSQTVSPILSSPMTVVGFDKVGNFGEMFGAPLFETVNGHPDEMGELFPELANGSGIRIPTKFNTTAMSALDGLTGASDSITDDMIAAITPTRVSLSVPVLSPPTPTSLTMTQANTSPSAAISRTLSSSSSSSLSSSSSSFHIQPGLSPAVTIPWSDENHMPENLTEKATMENLKTRLTKIAPNPSMYALGNSRMGVGMHTSSIVPNNRMNANVVQQTSTRSQQVAHSSLLHQSSSFSSPSSTSTSVCLPSRTRKRPNSEAQKSSDSAAEELAIKRAKNTDAARRSRLRKVMKMESLEGEVGHLKEKNNELEKKVAVLESEKKNLEERSEEREQRVRELEKLLSEAHQRLIGKM